MYKKTITILGISPGTKYVAFALFKDSELREWFIKAFKGGWSKGKKAKIISVIAGLVSYYGVTALAIKRLHPSRTSRHLDSLVLEIRDLAEQRKLRVLEYPIKHLERSFCADEKWNKKNLAEKVVQTYPVLFREHEKEKSHLNPYYIRLFEAVALGSIGHGYLDKTMHQKIKNHEKQQQKNLSH